MRKTKSGRFPPLGPNEVPVLVELTSRPLRYQGLTLDELHNYMLHVSDEVLFLTGGRSREGK